jgi:hypothetical protein
MSFQFFWPENGWPSEIEEKVRSTLESSIRKAMNASNNNQSETTMSNNQKADDNNEDGDDDEDDEQQQQPQPLSTLIRGSVTVDGLSLGTKAPTIILKRITELSPAQTSLQVHVEYKGDAWIWIQREMWSAETAQAEKLKSLPRSSVLLHSNSQT